MGIQVKATECLGWIWSVIRRSGHRFAARSRDTTKTWSAAPIQSERITLWTPTCVGVSALCGPRFKGYPTSARQAIAAAALLRLDHLRGGAVVAVQPGDDLPRARVAEPVTPMVGYSVASASRTSAKACW